MKRVRFTKAAEGDVQNAFAGYEGERPGLGIEFLERVDQAVLQIAKHPLAARVIVGETRRIVLQQFPYGLWYRVEADAIVIACLHHKRDNPKLARQRASGQEPKPRKLGP